MFAFGDYEVAAVIASPRAHEPKIGIESNPLASFVGDKRHPRIDRLQHGAEPARFIRKFLGQKPSDFAVADAVDVNPAL